MHGSVNKLIISTQKVYYLLNICDILYCRSHNSYTTFYFKDYEQVKVSISIKQVEEKLKGHNFIRPHQSYLVNLNYIQSVSRKQEVKIYINGGIIIPVSKRNKKSVIENIEKMFHFQIP